MLVTLKGRKSLLYLWEKQGRKCPICGEPIDTHKAWDVMPTVQNGKNAICWFMMNVLNYPANQMEKRSSLSQSLHTNRGLEKLDDEYIFYGYYKIFSRIYAEDEH